MAAKKLFTQIFIYFSKPLRLLYFTQIFIYFSKPLRLLYSLIIYEIVNFSFFSLLFATSFFLSISEKCSYIRDCSCIYNLGCNCHFNEIRFPACTLLNKECYSNTFRGALLHVPV